MEISRNKHFKCFKLYTVLSSIMKSCTSPVHPTWNVNYPFVRCSHNVCIPCLLSHLNDQVGCLLTTVLVFKSHLVTVPQYKSNDAGHSDMPKKSREVHLLSETCGSSQFNKERKKSVLRLLRSIRETVKKEIEICASFAVAL